MDCAFAINANASLTDIVAPHVRQECALISIGKAQMDIVVPGLNAESCLHGQTGDCPLYCLRSIRARKEAVIVLMELVALGRVRQKIGEVVEEIELAFDGVDIRLPRSEAVGSSRAHR